MQHAFIALVFADTATPTPQPTVDPTLVTPGPWGFAVIALLALAVVALIWDMMRRIRRGRVRADINEELDAEQRAAAQDEAPAIQNATQDGASGEDAPEKDTPEKDVPEKDVPEAP